MHSACGPLSVEGSRMAARNVFIALSVVVGFLAPQGRAQSATTPKFEVASIKPCKAGDVAPVPGGKSGRVGRVSGSPRRLNAECQTVANLIPDAYLSYPKGERWPQPVGSLTPLAPVSDRLRFFSGDQGKPGLGQLRPLHDRGKSGRPSKRGNDAGL